MNYEDLRLGILILTSAGMLSGLAAAGLSLGAALVRVEPNRLTATLKVGARPDDPAGDAAVIALQAADRARVLADESRAAATRNQAAALLTIVSVVLTSAAGVMGALASAPIAGP